MRKEITDSQKDPHEQIQHNPDSPLDDPNPPNEPTLTDLEEYNGGSGGKTGIEDLRKQKRADV